MALRCVLLLCLIPIAGAFDPCVDHYYLHDSGGRSPSCPAVNNESDNDITDHWYRVVNLTRTLNLTSRYVPANRCGSANPIWLNGSHPSVSDDVVNRTACTTSSNDRPCCSNKFTILIKNCSTFYVYYLRRTRPGQRYCFDSDTRCPSTETSTTTTTMTWLTTTDIGDPPHRYPKVYSSYSMFACVMFIGGFLIGVLSVSIIVVIRSKRAVFSRQRTSQPAPIREPARCRLPPSYSEAVGRTAPVHVDNSKC